MTENIVLPGMSAKETLEIIPEKTILLGYVGSIAHGTHIPSDDPDSIDDKDILGICIADERVYFGLQRFEQKEVKRGEWDSVVYEIRKFFRLLLQQNPNVLGLLWLRKENYVHISESGRMILDNRNIFVSKAAYESFAGYSRGQLHRMTHGAYMGYMGAKRKRLVQKFGYDCKNAAHLIRLLRMCIEFLHDGELRVFREDAEELKEIKSGKWTLEHVHAEAGRLFKDAEEACRSSRLPPAPDRDAAERLLVSIVKTELEGALFY